MITSVKKERKPVEGKLPVIITALLFAIVIWFSISLSDQFYTTIELPLKIINIPEGNSISSNIPDKISLKIKAQGWRVIAIRNLSDPVFIASIPNETGTVSINLKRALSENNWLTSEIQVLDIFPEIISVNIDRTVAQIKKIEPDISLSFKDGYGLARPLVMNPESTSVFGTKRTLDKMKTLKTVTKNFNHVEKGFSEKIQLKNIPGVLFEQSNVEILFDVLLIVEREIGGIIIDVRNIPPDRKVVLVPDRVTVGIQGGIEILGRLKTEDIHAFIEYKDILSDTLESLVPNFIFPSYVKMIYLKPDFVKPIIKKY